MFKKDGAWQGDVGVYRGLFDDEKPPGPWPCVDTDCIPAGTLSVPVLVDDNGTQYDTQMVAGSLLGWDYVLVLCAEIYIYIYMYVCVCSTKI